MRRGVNAAAVLVAALAAAFAALVSCHASATLYIQDFQADLTLSADGALQVVETLTVVFEAPHHGIERYIAVSYHTPIGTRVTIDFRLDGVTLDGAHVNVTQSSSEGLEYLRIGDPDRTITGTHVYRIAYTAGRVLLAHPSDLQLYWNVTGSDWEIPIRQASATLSLPASVLASRVSAVSYSGYDRSTGVGQPAVMDNAGRLSFSTGTLNQGSGLTIDVSIPRSAMPLTAPTPTQTESVALRVLADGSGDYPTLAAALTAAPEGATIRLGEGVFAQTEPLVIQKPVQLIGAGMNLTVITSEAPAATVCVSSQGRFSAEGIAFLHQGNAIASAVVVDAAELDVQRCRFAGAMWDPAFPEDGSIYAGLEILGSTAGLVSDCILALNTGEGIAIRGTAQVLLEGNTCISNEGCGIYFAEAASGTARLNRSLSNSDGIYVEGQAAPTLESNTCQGNAWDGIKYHGNAGGTAKGNQCLANAASGIVVAGQATPTLDGNICQGNKWEGIAYVSSAAGTATGNQCQGNDQRGIELRDEAAPTLEGNTCQGNKWSGIAYYDSSAGMAKSNQCLGNEQRGIHVSGQAKPTLNGNTCQGNKAEGIGYYGTAAGTARDNQCLNNGGFGISVVEQAAPTLDSNLCRANSAGIGYGGTASGTARSNQCLDNEFYGFFITQQAAPALDSNVCSGNKKGSGIAYGGAASGTAVGNECQANGRNGISVGEQASPTLDSNFCRENQSTGIAYGGTASGVSKGNQCVGNATVGISVAERAAPSLEANVCERNQVGIYVASTAQPRLNGNVCRRNTVADVLDQR